MTYSLAFPDDTVAFFARDTPLDQVDKSIVTSAISANDLSVPLNWLKRGKAAGQDEIPNNGYRDYAYSLSPVLAVHQMKKVQRVTVVIWCGEHSVSDENGVFRLTA